MDNENFQKGYKSGYARALNQVQKALNELKEKEQPAINVRVNGEELSILADMLNIVDKPNSIISLRQLMQDYPQFNLIAFAADMMEWFENSHKELKSPVAALRRWCMNADKFEKQRVKINPSIMPSIDELWDIED